MLAHPHARDRDLGGLGRCYEHRDEPQAIRLKRPKCSGTASRDHARSSLRKVAVVGARVERALEVGQIKHRADWCVEVELDEARDHSAKIEREEQWDDRTGDAGVHGRATVGARECRMHRADRCGRGARARRVESDWCRVDRLAPECRDPARPEAPERMGWRRRPTAPAGMRRRLEPRGRPRRSRPVGGQPCRIVRTLVEHLDR
jgi:hypothetical protein